MCGLRFMQGIVSCGKYFRELPAFPGANSPNPFWIAGDEFVEGASSPI